MSDKEERKLRADKALADAKAMWPAIEKDVAAFAVEPVMLRARYEDDPVGMALVERYLSLQASFLVFAEIACEKIVENVSAINHVAEQRDMMQDRNKQLSADNEAIRTTARELEERLKARGSVNPSRERGWRWERTVDGGAFEATFRVDDQATHQLQKYQQQLVKTFLTPNDARLLMEDPKEDPK